jgi:hypothetical protein
MPNNNYQKSEDLKKNTFLSILMVAGVILARAKEK